MSAAPASHIYFSQRLRLHFIDWGNETADAMLMVHGIHDHCRTWDALASEFAHQYHVIAPDLRGHGDSEWVKGSSYQYLDYIYDLHQLISQTDIAPVTLVVIEGIGLWSAMQPPVPVHERIREWVAATRALAARGPRRYASLSEAYQRMQQANPQLAQDRALHLTIHGSNQNEDGTFSWKYDNYTYNFSSAGVATDDVVQLWRRITCPVLIINASDGLEHRIGHDNTLRHFNLGQLYVVQDAGHWTYHDRHAEVTQQMSLFLAAEQ